MKKRSIFDCDRLYLQHPLPKWSEMEIWINHYWLINWSCSFNFFCFIFSIFLTWRLFAASADVHYMSKKKPIWKDSFKCAEDVRRISRIFFSIWACFLCTNSHKLSFLCAFRYLNHVAKWKMNERNKTFLLLYLLCMLKTFPPFSVLFILINENPF